MKRLVIQVSSQYTPRGGGEKKWRNANVGSAFVRDNGEVSLQIDPGISIASSDDVRITLREPFDRDSPRKGGRRDAGQAGGYGGDDEDLPF